MATLRDHKGEDEATVLRRDLARAHHDFCAWHRCLLSLVERDGRPRSLAEDDAACAHAVCAQDATVHVVLRDLDPLFGTPMYRTAALQWQVGSAALSRYMQEVFAASEACVGKLGPELLDQPVDLSSVGVGKPSVIWVINHFVIAELEGAYSQ